jgi:hypothetical protein
VSIAMHEKGGIIACYVVVNWISSADLLFSHLTAVVVFNIKFAECGHFFNGTDLHSILTINISIPTSVLLVQIFAL